MRQTPNPWGRNLKLPSLFTVSAWHAFVGRNSFHSARVFCTQRLKSLFFKAAFSLLKPSLKSCSPRLSCDFSLGWSFLSLVLVTAPASSSGGVFCSSWCPPVLSGAEADQARSQELMIQGSDPRQDGQSWMTERSDEERAWPSLPRLDYFIPLQLLDRKMWAAVHLPTHGSGSNSLEPGSVWLPKTNHSANQVTLPKTHI